MCYYVYADHAQYTIKTYAKMALFPLVLSGPFSVPVDCTVQISYSQYGCAFTSYNSNNDLSFIARATGPRPQSTVDTGATRKRRQPAAGRRRPRGILGLCAGAAAVIEPIAAVAAAFTVL